MSKEAMRDDPASHAGTAAASASLHGRVALVVGGAGAIGSAVGRRLQAAGARLVSADRAHLAHPDGAEAHACDLTRPAEVEALVAAVRDTHGRLDAVVHCAGITRDGVLWKLSDADWREVLATNLDSAFYLLRAAIPVLRATGGGSVVLVASINGERGKFGQANYAASKAGLIALARSAAREIGRFGVRVNALAPGWIDTPMTAAAPDHVRQQAIQEAALGRVGSVEDVAGAALFLCSDLSRHVTGQVLRVDGGQLTG